MKFLQSGAHVARLFLVVEGVFAWYKDSAEQNFEALIPRTKFKNKDNIEKSNPEDTFRLTFYHWISTRLISCKLELLILNT